VVHLTNLDSKGEIMISFYRDDPGSENCLSVDQVLIVTGLDLLNQRPVRDQLMDEPFRSHLVDELERSLVSRQRFRLYMRALDNILGTRKPAAAEIDEVTFSSVLNNGLAVLPDRDLLRLGLDGAALLALHLCIKQDGGPYWSRFVKMTLFGE